MIESNYYLRSKYKLVETPQLNPVKPVIKYRNRNVYIYVNKPISVIQVSTIILITMVICTLVTVFIEATSASRNSYPVEEPQCDIYYSYNEEATDITIASRLEAFDTDFINSIQNNDV